MAMGRSSSSILYDLYELHNSAKYPHLRDESITDSEVNQDLKRTLKALETKTLSEKDAHKLKREKRKYFRCRILKMVAAAIVCTSLTVPCIYHVAKLDVRRNNLHTTMKDVDYLQRLAEAIVSVGEELDITVITHLSPEPFPMHQNIEGAHKKTNARVKNLDIDFKLTLFSFGTLLKTKSRFQQALSEIRTRTKNDKNDMVKSVQDYSILVSFLMENFILSVNEIPNMELPFDLLRCQKSQIATTALQMTFAYWALSFKNETCLRPTCEDTLESIGADMISSINVFIGAKDSMCMTGVFPKITSEDVNILLKIRHAASESLFSGKSQTSNSRGHTMDEVIFDTTLLQYSVAVSTATINSLKLKLNASTNEVSQIIALYICALLFSVILFGVLSFLYHCQLKSVGTLNNLNCLLGTKVENQIFGLETILLELVPQIYTKMIIEMGDVEDTDVKSDTNCKIFQTQLSENSVEYDDIDLLKMEHWRHTTTYSTKTASEKNHGDNEQRYPTAISKSLRTKGHIQTGFRDNITMFKCDFIMLKDLVQAFSPRELVNILTCLTQILEQRTKLYDVFVLSHDVDSFTVVAGMTSMQSTSTHAEIIANMAMDILNTCSDLEINSMPDSKLRMRIGIHTGSGYTSVITLPTPKYQVHGDILETTRHLQKTSLPNRIQISEATAMSLKKVAVYDVQKRGFTVLPNGCIIETQWLLGRRVSVCLPMTQRPSVRFNSPLQLEQKPVYHFDKEEMKYIAPRTWLSDMHSNSSSYAPTYNRFMYHCPDDNEENNYSEEDA